MNVKKQIFEKDNKENILFNSSSQKQITLTKQRANIGEQIRKKLKITAPPASFASVLAPRDLNAAKVKATKLEEKKTERTHFMQRSVDLGNQTSRSVKSVHFQERADQTKLTRKHSTSSILKNNKATKKPRFSDKLSMNNSVCSNILKDDQSTENLSFNKICKQKYERQHETLKKTEKMYTDELFPQILSSISRCQDPAYKELKWMRLSQIYKGKYVTIWDSTETIKIQASKFSRSNLLPTCLNAIKYNNFMLQKMFQSQGFNQNGIYYIKINQNNSWKYTIIDDYIPVYREDKKIIPAFFNVTSENAHHQQIWPYLLHKAYAKFYSNYQCLELGNQVDFLQELTGCYPEEMDPTSYDFQEIVREVNNYDSILIGRDHNYNYFPIVPRKAVLTCQDPSQNFSNMGLTADQFKQKFPRIHCIQLHKYFYSGFCTIKYNNKNSADSQRQSSPSIRMIKVDEPTQCNFSLVQKDGKHYYLGDYRYVWVRLIVVMKESQKNYRWVGGLYAADKYANLTLWLEPAQYLIFVIPEWKGKGYDLTLTFQGNIKVEIDRKPYHGNEHILIQAAMDLAQSKGRLKQLNQSICTYSYIEHKLGLIIENINNQRPNGFVRVLRSIEGLQKCGENLIRAYNREFGLSNTVEAKIQSLGHFTVVLAVQGGINRAFLDQFDFGS